MKAKRYLAILLAIAMVFGAVSLASAASVAGAQFSDISDASQKDSIGLLGALGVVQGHGGTNNFAPADNLTRAEFAVMMSRLIGQEDAAKVMAALGSNFTDADAIADWALGYINFAAANGWLKGFPDGSVQATGTLTLPQAVTVVLRVLGYGNTVPDSAYPAGHLAKGAQLGLTRGVPIGGQETPITRNDMARIVANALFVPQMGDDGKIGDSIVAGQVIKGRVVAAGSSEITLNVKDPADSDKDQTTRKFADSVTIVGNAASLGGLVGLTVEAFTADVTDANEKVFLIRIATGDVDGITGVFAKFDEDRSGDSTKYLLVLKDGTKVEYTSDTQYSVNGTGLEKNPFGNLNENDEVAIYSAGGVATSVYATRWTSTNRLFDSVDKQTITLAGKADNPGTVKTTGSTTITLNGEVAELKDLKANDVLDVVVKGRAKAYSSTNAYNVGDEGDAEALVIRATRNVLEGTVTEVLDRGSAGVTITLRLADGTSKSVRGLWSTAADTFPGQKVKLALNAGGAAVVDLGHGLGGTYGKLLNVGTRYVDGVTRDIAFFDVGGESVSYFVENSVDPSTWATDEIGRLHIDAAGQVVDFYPVGTYADGEIYSISNDVLMIKAGSSYYGVSANAALYQEDSLGSDEPDDALKASNFSVGTKVRFAMGVGAKAGDNTATPPIPALDNDSTAVVAVLKKVTDPAAGGPSAGSPSDVGFSDELLGKDYADRVATLEVAGKLLKSTDLTDDTKWEVRIDRRNGANVRKNLAVTVDAGATADDPSEFHFDLDEGLGVGKFTVKLYHLGKLIAQANFEVTE